MKLHAYLSALSDPGRVLFLHGEFTGKRMDHLVKHIDLLRRAVRDVRRRYPFHVDAWVVLPDHLHCIWTLPPGDDDFSNRWKAIKIRFVQALPRTERRSKVRMAKGERGVWRRRYWERVIRNERDYSRHVNYIHYKSVKHGLVRGLVDWPYSTAKSVWVCCQSIGVEAAERVMSERLGNNGRNGAWCARQIKR